MLKLLGAAALQDIVGILKDGEKFFTLTSDSREAHLNSHLKHYPVSFKEYMKRVSPEDFLEDIGAAIQVITGLGRASENLFLEALIQYIAVDLGEVLDRLDSAFFFLDFSNRMNTLENLIKGDSILASAAREYFIERTYQEITQEAGRSIGMIKHVPVIVIQSPVELSSDRRREIREAFLERHPFSFPEFQVNPQIIGGLRLFVDGDVEDHSWLARIQKITSL